MTIVNPNSVPDDLDEPFSKGLIRVRKLFRSIDYEASIDKAFSTIDAHIIGVDAKLRETYHRQGKPFHVYRHYRSMRELRESTSFWKRVNSHLTPKEISEAAEKFIAQGPSTRLRETDEFSMGRYPDETATQGRSFGLQDTYLPTLGSTYAKQQTWVDYQDAHAKAWEAYTKNPIAKRIVRIISQFVLGRGVTGKCGDARGQEVWNSFYRTNDMRLRIKGILRELVIYGEIFNRFFQKTDGLAIRSIDPSTIWDIVTNPEDLEEVLYYHQQYVVATNSPIVGIKTPSKLIIRQIPPDQVDHFAINNTFAEKRGRSELFTSLPWLLRFKEFMNDRVLLNKMRSLFAIDVKVTGGSTEIDAAEAQFSTPPGPGAALVHNEAVEISYKNATLNASDAETDANTLLHIVAVGAGLSDRFLGTDSASTRAGALLSSEPDVKNFEDYQELVDCILHKIWDRLVVKHGLSPSLDIEFVFPALASEDRSSKLKDIILAEGADYISKQRAAETAAAEFRFSTYDFVKEQETIKQERDGLIRPVMPLGMSQTPKFIDPQDQADIDLENSIKAQKALSDLQPEDGAEEGQEEVDAPPQEGGDSDAAPFSAGSGAGSKTGGRDIPNTKATLNRPSFTRASEEEAIKGKKSSGLKSKKGTGTPQRESSNYRGWSEKARAAALLTRRTRSEQRRLQELAEE